jgi:hypothetical protein
VNIFKVRVRNGNYCLKNVDTRAISFPRLLFSNVVLSNIIGLVGLVVDGEGQIDYVENAKSMRKDGHVLQRGVPEMAESNKRRHRVH